MAPFATTAELGLFLGETLTGTRLAQASSALDIATADIQGWTRRRLERITGETVTLNGTRARELVLPDWPVISVASVTLDGVAVSSAGYRRVGRVLYREAGWGTPGGVVTVTYTHGYSPIPTDIRAVTLRMAAQALANPAGIRQEGIGSYSVTYAGDNPGGASDGLLGSLSRYRVRAASPSLVRESMGTAADA